MKREKWEQSLWSGVGVFCLTAGSLGCMVSGLDLMTEPQFFPVLLWCGLFAGVFSLIAQLRLAGVAAGVFLAVLGLRWFYGPLEASCAQLVLEISTLYHSGYGWPIVTWGGEAASLGSALRALAGIMSLIGSFVCLRRGSCWALLPLSTLPLASTLLLTDTAPAWGYFALYFFGFLFILLSQGVRRRNTHQGNLLCRYLVVPVAGVLLAVFALNPQSGYDKQALAEKLEQAVLSIAQRFTAPEAAPPSTTAAPIRVPVSGDTSDLVNLENVGPKSRQTQWVMTLESTGSGVLYLRGSSFASYDGHTWRVGDQAQGASQWPQFLPDTPQQQLQITTRSPHSVQYLPYYSPLLESVSGGRQENPENLKTYQVPYYAFLPGRLSGEADCSPGAQYLQLPDSTRDWAQGVVISLLGSASVPQNATQVYEAAEKIGDLVRASAEYSLETGRMPDSEADFARWFLEKSETGYCVHFSSTAAVLLRAAGIPSRYVTGYMAQVEAGKLTTVRLADAHAWVEYYLPGLGWAVLEATPGSGDAPVPPVQTDPTGTTPGPTEPDSTDPDATGPSQTTPASTNPDAPDQTTGIPLPGETGPTQPGPEGTGPGSTQPPTPPASKPVDLSWLKYVALALALPAALLGQWWVRVQLRRQRLNAHRGNRRALAYWQEAERYARLLGEKPPQALLSLARKAKFSQYTLSREELAPFRAYLKQGQSQLEKKPWQYQVLYRLVYALY